MPFIIWGSRGITSTVEHGEFFCPQCDQQEEYVLKQVRPFFTLYFIPLFPVGAADRYVECRGCKKTFKEEVLKYEPPNETERLLRRIYDELVSGTSVEVLRKKMENQGVPANEAEEMLEQMCDGKRRNCSCGQSFHESVRRCTSCGESL